MRLRRACAPAAPSEAAGLYDKAASAAHNARKPYAARRRRFGQVLNHGHHEVIRGLDVLHGLSPDAVDAVHHDVIGRPRIKVGVAAVVGAPLNVAFSFDHLIVEAVVIILLPVRNLEARRENAA